MLGQTQIMLCPEFKLGDDSGPVSVLEFPLCQYNLRHLPD
jgi:hypothetical protein